MDYGSSNQNTESVGSSVEQLCIQNGPDNQMNTVHLNKGLSGPKVKWTKGPVNRKQPILVRLVLTATPMESV